MFPLHILSKSGINNKNWSFYFYYIVFTIKEISVYSCSFLKWTIYKYKTSFIIDKVKWINKNTTSDSYKK